MNRFRLPARPRSPSYRTRMLLVLVLGWAGLQVARFLLPPLLPRITGTLGLSPGGIGLALTGFGLVYAVVQYPSGTYSDVLSRATLLVPGFLVLLASTVVITFAVAPWAFVAGLVVFGIGKGLFASPSRALVSDLFEDRRGRALGVYSAGTDIGALAASGLAVATLAVGVGWRVAFVPVVLTLALVGLLFVVWNREPYELRRVELSPRETAGRIAATRDQRELVAVYALFYFVVGGLTNFFPTLLVEAGFSEAAAGGSFALLFAVGLVAKPTAGELSDRFSRLVVGSVALALAAAGLALVLLAPSLPTVAVGTILVAAGYKTQFPIADAVVMEAAPEGSVGADIGAARAVFLGASALGPGVVGVVAELSSFEAAFWLLVVGFLLSAAVLARQYRR
ncbi:MAG: sugar phosphate permease [halophilic archaeon J07HX64]|nr:MAG: sugar phosphate permease [halophilic archaeon J07HX64]